MHILARLKAWVAEQSGLEDERFKEFVDEFPTAIDAARAMGVSKNYIYQILAGRRRMTDAMRWRWFLAGGAPDVKSSGERIS